MPSTFAEIPFFRIALVFLAGIILHRLTPEYDLRLGLLAVAMLLIGLYLFLKRTNAVLYSSLILLALTFFAAYMRSEGLAQSDRDLHFTQLHCGDQYLLEGVITEVNERQNGMAMIVAIKRASCEQGSLQSDAFNRGKLLLTTRGKDRLDEWIPGTELRFITAVGEIPPPSNPGAFSYKDFMARKRVYHRAFIAEKDLHIISTENNKFQSGIFKFRRAFIDNLKDNTHSENTAGILAGIVLGDKSLMDEDIHKAFRDVGAAHVLAVSGLHVGIVFSLLFFGLKRLPDWVTAVISLAGIWAFILLAGMPPSAMRAGTMFSLFSLGKLFKKKAHPINILSFCALIHLFIEPQLAFDVGFQFSYLALLGIIVFFNKINAVIPCPHPYLKLGRDLVSLSIAAQMGVLPLSIYYFHQASPYFMLSSIFSVMGAYLLLCGGLFVGLIGFALPSVAKIAGYILDWAAEWLSVCMLFFTELPGATVREMYFSTATVVILYLLITLSALILYKRIKNYQPLLMLSLVFFLFSGFSSKQEKMSSNSVYIYSSGRALLIDVFSPDKLMTIHCPNLTEQTEQFAVQSNRIIYRSKNREQKRVETDSLSNLHIIRGAQADVILCSYNLFPESLIKRQDRPFHLIFTHFDSMEKNHFSLLEESKIISITSAAGNSFAISRDLESFSQGAEVEFYNTFHQYQSFKNF